MKQVRKIKPTRRSVSGYIPYQGQPLAYESTLERDFLIYHTFRQDVIDIVPQPISIPFQKNGRTYSYTPDYFIQFKASGFSHTSPSLIVEVKPESEWRENWRDWSDKWKAAMRYAKSKGFRFAIYDESRIRHDALDNINFLNAFYHLAVDKGEINIILKEIEMRGHTTVEVLLEKFFKGAILRNQGKRILWYMMVHRLVGFDIWSDIKNEKMEVWCE